MPGMPDGKPAGVRCLHLPPDHRCVLFGTPERPAVCARLRPTEEMCGRTREEVLTYLARLERATVPMARDPRGAARRAERIAAR